MTALRAGEPVGRVVRVEHFPAQDLLVVDTGEREVLIPFVSAIVPSVDIEAGTVTLTPPTGLFEDIAEEPEPAAAPSAETRDTGDSGDPGDPTRPEL